MSSSNARNIVELRQLLAARFPGVRMSAEARESIVPVWPTGLPQVDSLLQGGLPKGGITEMVSSGIASGTLLFLESLLRQAHQRGESLALVDGSDSFDPTGLDGEILSRLIWVRCSGPREAIKAVDLLLHDGTIPVVVLDLLFCHATPLRRTPSSTWFRLQRILENHSTALVVFSPEHMISNANARLSLDRRFSLETLDQRRETLLAQISPAAPQAATRRRIVKSA